MQKSLDKLQKELVIYCPLCNGDYQPKDLKTVESTQGAALMHSQCPKCRGSILSLFYHDLLGVTMVGLATDLDFNDVLRFKNASCVTQDDILETYQLLH